MATIFSIIFGLSFAIYNIVKLPVREQIGRFKYIAEENTTAEYDAVCKNIDDQLAKTLVKEED